MINNYDNISFTDEFEPEDVICEVCGCDEMPRVGYNEKEDLLKFECPDCGAVFIADEKYKFTMIKGEKRDWLEYLAANLKFPFNAVVSEMSGEEFFNKDYAGPIRYKDKLKVLSVDFEDDRYGIIVSVKKDKKKYFYSLVDLDVVDKKSTNAKLIGGYINLFSNSRM